MVGVELCITLVSCCFVGHLFGGYVGSEFGRCVVFGLGVGVGVGVGGGVGSGWVAGPALVLPLPAAVLGSEHLPISHRALRIPQRGKGSWCLAWSPLVGACVGVL